MVGVFAGLKWRLVTSRIRASRGGTKIGMVILLVVVVAFLGLTAVGLASLRAVPDAPQADIMRVLRKRKPICPSSAAR